MSTLSRRWRLAAAAPVLLVAAAGVLAPRPQAAEGMSPVAFVQQASGHTSGVANVTAKPAKAVKTGNRLIVEVGVSGAKNARAKAVTDNAGNTYTELLHVVGDDGAEQSVWTAPITNGGTRPTVKATATGKAKVGLVVLEYSGLSTAAGAAVMDTSAHAVGTTDDAVATSVSSGAAGSAVEEGEAALAFYSDAGYGNTVTGGDMWVPRASVGPASDMDLFVEDMVLMSSDNPDGVVGTGPRTPWVMSTVVFRAAGPVAPVMPGAPGGVSGVPGDGVVTLVWNAPTNGGSPITSYTITPSANGTPQAPVVVSGAPPLTRATISGLTNDTPYTFTVSATNAVGTGPVSPPSSPVTPAATPPTGAAGQWSALATSPIVAVHSMLLPNGSLLQFDGWLQPQPTYVFDPATNSYTEVDAPDSIFCAGNAFLPDGRVITIGGYGSLKGGNLGIKDTAVFDPATSTWTRVADMKYDRWYPTLTQLSDGRYLALSGNSVDMSTWADTPEVYDPTANTWTPLTRISTSQVHEEEYPFSFLVPSGKVFTIGPSEDLSFLMDVDAQTWTPTGGASGVVNGSSVMYRPGKILYSGGAPTVLSTSNAAATTSVIDLTTINPTWRRVAPMNYSRVYHTLTMLADGRVLAIGGEATSDQNVVKTGVLPTEIWDPATETWSEAAPIAASRNYHATTALLPDGRVLVGGGGHPNSSSDPGQFSTQIYSPSYLFNGPRPVITSATDAVTWGGSISVATPDAASIGSVNLVNLAADTHQTDMNQHFVPLDFTTTADGTLSVTAPASSSIAPAGNYMLFILNKKGVPSVSAPVRILTSAPTPPSAPTGVSAVAGNASATVSWTAPTTTGGAPVTSYVITPYAAGVPQPATTVTGAPPATATTVTGLTNGTSYTFTVAARTSAGTGSASAPSAAVVPAPGSAPAFVQAATARVLNASTLTVTPSSTVTAGNRIVVEVGVWDNTNRTAAAVTDSSGNTYTEVAHYVASDGTEQSVWSAPVVTGGVRPVITVRATGVTDIGVSALEYAGLSTAPGMAAVDTQAHAVGKTGTAAATVQSGATAATTGPGLAVGFYTDSGFGVPLTAASGWAQRVNVSPVGDMQMLVEDQLVATGATPNAGTKTGKQTIWLMGTVVFKGA